MVQFNRMPFKMGLYSSEFEKCNLKLWEFLWSTSCQLQGATFLPGCFTDLKAFTVIVLEPVPTVETERKG